MGAAICRQLRSDDVIVAGPNALTCSNVVNQRRGFRRGDCRLGRIERIPHACLRYHPRPQSHQKLQNAASSQSLAAVRQERNSGPDISQQGHSASMLAKPSTTARPSAVPQSSSGHSLAISLASSLTCEQGTMTVSTRIRGLAGPAGAAIPASTPARREPPSQLVSRTVLVVGLAAAIPE